MSVDDIIRQYNSSRHFYQGGGLTVSGGEPLIQVEFVTQLFEAAKKEKIHTCLDTSGITFCADSPAVMKQIDRLLDVTDLILLDIKHIDPKEHQLLCGQPNSSILEFARYLDLRHIPVWIRHVVVPGITDHEESLFQLGEFIGTLKNVKALDVLPYHDMGKNKYKELGIEYPLKNTPPLSKENAIKARKIILCGIKVGRKREIQGIAPDLEQ